MSRLNEDAALLIQLHKAEARVKELEANMSEKPPRPLGWQTRYLQAEARIKELEAERDDLLRLGNNHK